MKKIYKAFFAICILLLFPAYLSANPMFGRKELIVDDWRFKLDASTEAPEATDKWQKITLPHDWTVRQPYSPDKASATGYLPGGIGWYYKELNIPKQEQENKIFIYFEGVYNNSEVYLNGHLLGKRPNGYVSFMYDMTPYIQYDKPNQLYVRVDHSLDADSRWYTGSGIYRDVYVVYANPVHIDLWGIFWRATEITDKSAEVTVTSTLKNESGKKASVTIQQDIIEKETGKSVAKAQNKLSLAAGATQDYDQVLKINNLKRWSMESPYLYELRTRVYVNNKLTEDNKMSLGIRTLTFDPNKGFALNDEFMKLKGVCIHHDAGVLGAAVPREVWKRRLQNLQAFGCNAIRMSHNPQAPDVYELCDELGLVVMDEAFDEWEYPKRKWLDGWNVGVPGFQGPSTFFAEWGERDLHDIVKRDRNYTSIIMWSIGNEVDYPNDPYSHPILDGSTINQPMFGGYKPDAPNANRLGDIAKQLAKVVRGLDTSRPVTAALAGVVMSNHTEYPFVVDVAGYNYTENQYDADHASYPDRVIYGSETGQSFEAWKAVRDNEFIFGQFLWTGTDYLGESGRWPSRGLHTGMLDFGSFPKPRAYFRRALWLDEPVAYLGTYPNQIGRRGRGANRTWLSMDAPSLWNYKDGDSIRVVCYTNAPQARLLLNGNQVGEVKPYDDNTGIIYWDVAYAPGKLEVEGLNNDGNVICRYDIQTTGRPKSITATADVTTICKDRGLSQITVQVVDENGMPVILSDEEVTCTIDGPLELLGLESSRNDDMTDYTDNRHRVYNGRLLAYVRATGDEGKATVQFNAHWLEGAQVEITIK